MRARELLDEDYSQNLESDLSNILVGAKGSGATELQTRDIIAQLQGMGYSVSGGSILNLLSRDPMVLNATPTVVRLADPTGEQTGTDPSQDTAAQVSDMAQKATKLG